MQSFLFLLGLTDFLLYLLGFLGELKSYFLDGYSLLWVVLFQRLEMGVKLLVSWGVNELEVDLLLVVVLGMSAPVYIFATATGEADTVDVQGV